MKNRRNLLKLQLIMVVFLAFLFTFTVNSEADWKDCDRDLGCPSLSACDAVETFKQACEILCYSQPEPWVLICEGSQQ